MLFLGYFLKSEYLIECLYKPIKAGCAYSKLRIKFRPESERKVKRRNATEKRRGKTQ